MPGPDKISFGDMRDMGVRGILVYCADYHCSHLVPMSGDGWPDNVRLSDLELAIATLQSTTPDLILRLGRNRRVR